VGIFPKTLSRILVVVAAGFAFVAAVFAADMAISGAGATFPYPIYAKWAEAFKANTGVSLNYQSIGSGGGIKQIENNTVDFGASDKPLDAAELEKNGLVQFPMIMGGIVPAINVKGIESGKLKLDGPTLAAIYLGEIKKWNDAAIAKLNPDLKLPAKAIAPVYRADGSGTTFLFTNYLCKVSPAFKEKVGNNTSVQWPTGLAGKGNEGVANSVRQTEGAIGYVEYAYAKQTKIPYALVKNAAGDYVAPDTGSFQAAAAKADWEKTPGFAVILTDQPGEKSWPIAGASFILMHKKTDKPDTTKAALDFFDWAYKNGAKMAEDLDYVPLPETVIKLVETTWTTITGPDGKPVWTGPKS
jgi:phosphate transport system substrate-binding protein